MRNFNQLSTEGQSQIASILLEELEHNFLSDETLDDQTDKHDLHNKLFNEDYFIIGYYEAEKFLTENTGIFNAIGIIKEYETDFFGECNTDLTSSESVVNMLAYIVGEELINDYEDDMTVSEIIKHLKENY